ncbi:MAG: hypothetical protein ACI8ZN_002381, partial [Bacteroidia bacterium]
MQLKRCIGNYLAVKLLFIVNKKFRAQNNNMRAFLNFG